MYPTALQSGTIYIKRRTVPYERVIHGHTHAALLRKAPLTAVIIIYAAAAADVNASHLHVLIYIAVKNSFRAHYEAFLKIIMQLKERKILS